MKTTVIEKLSDQVIAGLKNEMAQVQWQQHFSGRYETTGALREGTTSWVRKTTESLELIEDNTSKYPATMQIINRYLGHAELGRAYWHRLMPGNSIARHTDQGVLFADRLLHRYQVYLDIPSEAVLILDDAPQAASALENSVVDFNNLYLPHSYHNRSDRAFMFLVFDVLDKKH